MIINMQAETNTSPKSNPNDGAKPEIVAATQQVESLSRDAAWYDRWKDRADIFSVLLALVVFAAAFWGNRLGAKLARANKEVAAAKERLNNLQIAAVKSDAQTEATRIETEAQSREAQIKADAEVKIAEAHAVGKQADEKAGTANERAAELEKQNLALRGGVAGLEKEAAEARRRQAEAELRLEEIRKRQEPRWLPWDKFVGELKGKPTGAAEILYQPNDAEAYNLATEIQMALSFVGWQVSSPRPISSTDVRTVLRGAPESLIQAIPPTQRVGGQPFGVSIVANDLSTLGPPDPETPGALNALAKAFRATLKPIGVTRDEGLPDNVFRIVVAAKP